MALLNNELYVLCQRSDNQIDVYSTINFTLLRHLSFSGGTCTDAAIAACPRKRCLYVLNYSVVHRLGLDGSESKWPLLPALSPLSMSVTPSTQVLVLGTCGNEDGRGEVGKLVFLSSENGECVRTITPEVDPNDFVLLHCIQIKDDQYLLAYDNHEERFNGTISLLDGEGKVLRSTRAEDSMHFPVCMAVDSDQFVLVCNVFGQCILLFDPRLDFVCNLTEGIEVKPQGLVFDEFTRRLYILDSHHDTVAIVQL